MRLIEIFRFAREIWRWLRLTPARGSERYGLLPTAMYPIGRSIHGQIGDALSQRASALNLTPTTRCVSIGSCFAEELSGLAVGRNYNYPQYEENFWGFNANWGRVYTSVNFEQAVRYSFEPGYRAVACEGPKGWFDLLRDTYPLTVFAGEDEALADINRHRGLSRAAFESADVLFVTLGQNEVWRSKSRDCYWGSIPPLELFERLADDLECVELTFEDNVSALGTALGILKEHNPGLRVGVSVSPVPAQATFLHSHVIETSMYYKSLLRVVAENLARKLSSYVYYIPAYERVLCSNPISFRSDNRHVQKPTVLSIFQPMIGSGRTPAGQPGHCTGGV